ncbi:HAD-like protein [Pluteus cervinus]|uniref:HAD-like protein n=1 Tax=Pluteus cervinus TaxID=181527 RepID=A0ACD3B1D7_9AGAR|nr:HAD-like protein [Pluteus cervinus]
MPQATFTVDAILFDMDGTLVDSTAGVVGAWETFRETYPAIDVDHILSSAHGVRTVDNLRKYCGLEDPDKLKEEAERFEQAIVTSSVKDGRQGIVLLPGAGKIMAELSPVRFHPNPSWAICTSATRVYASAALQIAKVPVPDVFVTADDVKQGKPFPDPYLLGAENCGVKPENCVVFEDAPSGVRSGNAAGCKTVALLTTHSKGQIEASSPDYIVQDLSCVTIRRLERGVEVILDI